METARLWAQLNFLFPVGGNAPHATSPSTAASTKESK